MGVVDDPVAYGVCKGGIADHVVPQVDRKLARNDGRPHLVPVLHDFQEVPPLLVCKGVESPVVYDEQPHPLEPLEELHVAAVRAGDFQLLGQSRHPDVEGADALPDGAVAQGAGDVSFADAGRADHDEIVMVPDPFVLAEFEKAVLRHAPARPEVDVLEAGGRVPEVGLGGEDLELPVLPGELLLVDKKAEPFFKAEVFVFEDCSSVPSALPPCRGAS